MIRFGVGQNLYIYKQSIRLPPADWERAVTDWYDEVSLFSNRKVIIKIISNKMDIYDNCTPGEAF